MPGGYPEDDHGYRRQDRRWDAASPTHGDRFRLSRGRSGDAWPKGLDAGSRRREADRVAHRDPHITPYHAGSLSSERGFGTPFSGERSLDRSWSTGAGSGSPGDRLRPDRPWDHHGGSGALASPSSGDPLSHGPSRRSTSWHRGAESSTLRESEVRYPKGLSSDAPHDGRPRSVPHSFGGRTSPGESSPDPRNATLPGSAGAAGRVYPWNRRSMFEVTPLPAESAMSGGRTFGDREAEGLNRALDRSAPASRADPLEEGPPPSAAILARIQDLDAEIVAVGAQAEAGREAVAALRVGVYKLQNELDSLRRTEPPVVEGEGPGVGSGDDESGHCGESVPPRAEASASAAVAPDALADAPRAPREASPRPRAQPVEGPPSPTAAPPGASAAAWRAGLIRLGMEVERVEASRLPGQIIAASSAACSRARAAYARLLPASLVDEATGAPHGRAVVEDVRALPCFEEAAREPARARGAAIQRVLRRELAASLRGHVASSVAYRMRYEWLRRGGGAIGNAAGLAKDGAPSASGAGAAPAPPGHAPAPARGPSPQRSLRSADYARSDYEESVALARLLAVDRVRAACRLPAMGLAPARGARWRWRDENRFVRDPEAEDAALALDRPWSEAETRAFMDAFLVFHKDFARIQAAALPHRRVTEVVALFYRVQRSDEFAQTRRKYQLRKRREQTEVNVRARAAFMGMAPGGKGAAGAAKADVEDEEAPEAGPFSAAPGSFSAAGASGVAASADTRLGEASTSGKAPRRATWAPCNPDVPLVPSGLRGLRRQRSRSSGELAIRTYRWLCDLAGNRVAVERDAAADDRPADAALEAGGSAGFAASEAGRGAAANGPAPAPLSSGSEAADEEDAELLGAASAALALLGEAAVEEAGGASASDAGAAALPADDEEAARAAATTMAASLRLAVQDAAEKQGPSESQAGSKSTGAAPGAQDAADRDAARAAPAGAKAPRAQTSYWTQHERGAFLTAFRVHGRDWAALRHAVPGKTLTQIKNYYQNYRAKLGLDRLAGDPGPISSATSSPSSAPAPEPASGARKRKAAADEGWDAKRGTPVVPLTRPAAAAAAAPQLPVRGSAAAAADQTAAQTSQMASWFAAVAESFACQAAAAAAEAGAAAPSSAAAAAALQQQQLALQQQYQMAAFMHAMVSAGYHPANFMAGFPGQHPYGAAAGAHGHDAAALQQAQAQFAQQFQALQSLAMMGEQQQAGQPKVAAAVAASQMMQLGAAAAAAAGKPALLALPQQPPPALRKAQQPKPPLEKAGNQAQAKQASAAGAPGPNNTAAQAGTGDEDAGIPAAIVREMVLAVSRNSSAAGPPGPTGAQGTDERSKDDLMQPTPAAVERESAPNASRPEEGASPLLPVARPVAAQKSAAPDQLRVPNPVVAEAASAPTTAPASHPQPREPEDTEAVVATVVAELLRAAGVDSGR